MPRLCLKTKALNGLQLDAIHDHRKKIKFKWSEDPKT